jgi:MFS family permease
MKASGGDRSPAPRPAALDALGEPRYRRLWLAGLCVNAARWMDFLVLGWLTLSLTNSPLMVGLAGFCRSAPMIALGPLAGVVADRFHRGRVMLSAQVVYLASAVALALLFGTGLGRIGHLFVLEAVIGVAWTIDFPSRRAVLYTLVGPRRLTNAVALENVSQQGTKVLGPILGGMLLPRVGPTGCYVGLALLYVASLYLTASLNRRVALPGLGGAEPALASLAAGLREVRERPAIRAVLSITLLMNLLVFPYQQMLPVFARDVLAVGPELLGLLVAMDGLGALAGSLGLAARRRLTDHARVFVGGSLLAAALVIAFAWSPWYLLSVGLLFVIGLAESGFSTMQATIVLLAAPEGTRGRAIGILTACIGMFPVGTLWIGLAASRLGAPAAVAASTLLALALMLPVATRLVARSRG